MPYKYNPFTNNLDEVEDTSGLLSEITVTTDAGDFEWTSTGDLLGGTGINTAGATDTGTINLDVPVVEANGGTGQTTYAEGDVLYADASNSLAKLPRQNDGDVLTLASGIPSWAAAGGGGNDSIGYTSGNYYPANVSGFINTSSNKASSFDRTYTIPFYIQEDTTIDRVAFQVQVAGTSGRSNRLGIYNNVGGYPTTVLATLGTVLTDTTGVKELTVSQPLTKGFYHIGIQSDAVVTFFGVNGATTMFPYLPLGTSFATTNTIGFRYNSTLYSSGLPDLTGVTPGTYENVVPLIEFRIS